MLDWRPKMNCIVASQYLLNARHSNPNWWHALTGNNVWLYAHAIEHKRQMSVWVGTILPKQNSMCETIEYQSDTFIIGMKSFVLSSLNKVNIRF